MELTPAQKQIVKSTKRFRVANCGRRFGKTVLAREEMLACAITKNDRKVAYIAPTYQSARDILWNELKKRVHDIAVSINEARLEIQVKTTQGGTSYIVLRGWESVETLRGQSFDFIVLDEVAMMRNFFVQWQEVLIPTLTDRKGQALFISTPKGFNHFYDLCNMQGEDWEYFHFTTFDNPHIDDKEIEKLKLSMSDDAFAQEYMGDFRKQTGLVYKEFDRRRHLYKELSTTPRAIIGGVDFGFTNPTACVKIIYGDDRRFYVTNELYKTGMTEDEIVEYVGNQKFELVYPDPNNASAIEALRRAGVNVREVNKSKDSIISGISKIRELFKQNRLYIHESLVNLIFELESYAYPDTKNDRNPDELPEKKNDHLLDALRYAIMTYEPIITNNILQRKYYATPTNKRKLSSRSGV